MVRGREAGDAERLMQGAIAAAVRNGRRSLGWTQAQLGVRAAVSRSEVAMIEGGRTNLTFASVGRVLDALRARPDLRIEMPHLADRRAQLDPAHARCVGYVRRHLTQSGWSATTEVEIAGARSIGWIDILAFAPESGVVLVVEVKTELHDLGRVERTQAWYEREAWRAAQRLGWRPRRVVGLLLLLLTDANDNRRRSNREVLAGSFPARRREVRLWLVEPSRWPPGQRALAMVDPRRRGREWLRSTRTDGRRSPAPYLDYADFLRH